MRIYQELGNDSVSEYMFVLTWRICIKKIFIFIYIFKTTFVKGAGFQFDYISLLVGFFIKNYLLMTIQLYKLKIIQYSW